ncbi:MAG: folate-binding protein YgfZ, partial [Mesorhizobium sp.]
MPFALLKDRALISVSGQDAEHFLQNILTTDLDALGAGEAKPGALLSPQGKILFDFLISRAGENGFRLECRTDIADDFVRRLMLYRLRAKAEIAKQDQALVTVAWDDDSTASFADSTSLADTRFREVEVRRTYDGAVQDSGDAGAWRALRIANGIAESGSDYQLGDAFPHDVLLDETGGVGFKKGCYVGQEVVSRMQHRGTARRRV